MKAHWTRNSKELQIFFLSRCHRMMAASKYWMAWTFRICPNQKVRIKMPESSRLLNLNFRTLFLKRTFFHRTFSVFDLSQSESDIFCFEHFSNRTFFMAPMSSHKILLTRIHFRSGSNVIRSSGQMSLWDEATRRKELSEKRNSC